MSDEERGRNIKMSGPAESLRFNPPPAGLASTLFLRLRLDFPGVVSAVACTHAAVLVLLFWVLALSPTLASNPFFSSDAVRSPSPHRRWSGRARDQAPLCTLIDHNDHNDHNAQDG